MELQGLLQSIVFVVLCCLSTLCLHGNCDLTERRINQPNIDDRYLNRVAHQFNDIDRFNRTLSQILVPRVVGSLGHKAVQKYIKECMTRLDWLVESDAFTAETPLNNGTLLDFENIIATHNPNAQRRLILACHYDSKHFPDDVQFLGASDSAVPCAMLIDLAQSLHDVLRKDDQLSLQFVFFDGEEAFVEWSERDSLYGSRHLAEKWESADRLSGIDMLMLLDLLGLPDPQFYSLFRNTEPWYSRLVDAEHRLAEAGLLHQYQTSGMTRKQSNAYFQDQSINAFIDDDHVPFMRRGVPILHIIPLPFPDEWHTVDDDWTAIDFTTVDNLNRILRTFVCEYLNIDLSM